MKVEASSSCFENAGKSGVTDVAQVRGECEKRGKEYPFVEWAREEKEQSDTPVMMA
jgi:hypothetical protein